MIPQLKNHHTMIWKPIPNRKPSWRKVPQHQKMMCSFLFGSHHCLISTHLIFIIGTSLMPKGQGSIYITNHFNLENIREGLKCYPDLSRDSIYHNTFIAPEHFESLQCCITRSIHDHNAALQIWSENIAKYLVYTDLNPLLILNIL